MWGEEGSGRERTTVAGKLLDVGGRASFVSRHNWVVEEDLEVRGIVRGGHTIGVWPSGRPPERTRRAIADAFMGTFVVVAVAKSVEAGGTVLPAHG